MKTRQGFVSNSSSSSFILDVTPTQKQLLKIADELEHLDVNKLVDSILQQQSLERAQNENSKRVLIKQ